MPGSPTDKPDIVAPSHFFDLDDPTKIHSGTSTACAMVAASTAALREGWPGTSYTTRAADLRNTLRTTARKQTQTGPNNRCGHGILDLEAAIATL